MAGRMFAVVLEHGAAWDDARGLREQDGWDEHAAFMDALVDDGFVVLGGPFGDGTRVLHAVAADDEATVRARLTADPWHADGHLRIVAVEPWTVLLDGRAARPA
jgi:uncharacterized protein YciI